MEYFSIDQSDQQHRSVRLRNLLSYWRKGTPILEEQVISIPCPTIVYAYKFIVIMYVYSISSKTYCLQSKKHTKLSILTTVLVHKTVHSCRDELLIFARLQWNAPWDRSWFYTGRSFCFCKTISAQQDLCWRNISCRQDSSFAKQCPGRKTRFCVL